MIREEHADSGDAFLCKPIHHIAGHRVEIEALVRRVSGSLCIEIGKYAMAICGPDGRPTFPLAMATLSLISTPLWPFMGQVNQALA